MKERFSKTDVRILQELSKSFKSDLKSIGKKLKLSHSSIKYHIDKLVNKELIYKYYCINLNKIDLNLFLILLKTTDKEVIKESSEKCAKILSCQFTSSDFNVVLLFLGVDLNAAESFLTHSCVINNPAVIKTILIPLIKPYKDVVPINFDILARKCLNLAGPNKRSNLSCCNKCTSCVAYNRQLCRGCPLKEGYLGNLRLLK